jgi:hypothetical protein
MSRRSVTDPAAPIAGTRVAAKAPPNWTDRIPRSTSTGAGTRDASPGAWVWGAAEPGATDSGSGVARMSASKARGG